MYTKEEIQGAIEATITEGEIEFTNINEEQDNYTRFVELYTTLSLSRKFCTMQYTNKKDLTLTVSLLGTQVMLEIQDESILMSVQGDDD